MTTYRKRGLTDELDEGSFADFYLAMAQEFLERVDGARDGRYEARLPLQAAARFRTARRCSFTWITDRTTLAALALLHEGREVVGAPALRLLVLAQLVFTDAAVLEALGPAAVSGELADAAARLRDFFDEEAKESRRPPRRSPISKSLQTGALGCLGRGKGSIIDTVARYVETTLDEEACLRAYAELRAGVASAEDSLRLSLGLPRFRAHCVARLLWLHSAGALGASPDSARLGPGAVDALLRLTGESSEAGFAAALPRWRAAVLARDETDVVPRLEALNLFPLAAQTFEHLLCEAGKVFGLSPRPKRGPERPGYAELWTRARRFLEHSRRALLARKLQKRRPKALR